MSSEVNLVDRSPLRPWHPSALRAFLGTDYVDFSFTGGGDLTPMRLMASGDVRLYGELILEGGGLRSYGTIALTAIGSNDIVSFRSGGTEISSNETCVGKERLRIDTDGAICSAPGASIVLNTSPTGGIALELYNEENLILLIGSNGEVCSGTGLPLVLRAAESSGETIFQLYKGTDLEFSIDENGASCRFWNDAANLTILVRDPEGGFHDMKIVASGMTLSDGEGSEDYINFYLGTTHSCLRSFNPLRIYAYDDDTDEWQNVLIQGCDVNIQCLCEEGTFHFLLNDDLVLATLYPTATFELIAPEDEGASIVLDSSISGKKWHLKSEVDGTYTGGLSFVNETDTGAPSVFFKADSTVHIVPAGSVSAGIAFDSTATSGGRKWTISSKHGSPGQGALRFVNETDSGNPMVDFAPESDLGLHPASSHSATIQLDSTATSGGKRWSIRSEHGSPSQGSLKFTNESDSGTPMIRFTPAGSIYAAEYLGVKKITSTPTDSQGEIGAMVLEFDATYKRLWVKTNTDGNNKNWWYVNLVEP